MRLPEASAVPSLDTAFRVLGPLEVLHRGTVREVPLGRQQALLAALLLRAGEVVSASTLMEQVWGDSADRTVLNVCVMRLRRSLQDGDHELVRAEGSGYRIDVDPETVDLHQFRRLCAQAGEERDRGDPQTERAALHEALALWRGDAFAGIDSSLLQSEVVPILEEERLAAIEHRIDADLECGAHAEVIGELRRLVADHPFRERFWCQLLLALYRSGRQSEALDAYRAARRRLTAELGIEPGQELRELHHRILSADPDLLAPRSATGQAPRVAPAQLPPAVVGFSGRRDQLRQLDRLLDGTETAPTTLITGPPGVGKTTLAVHWASRHRDRWPDGQLYIDLRGYGPEAAVRPIEALAYLLRAIGVPADQVPGQTAEASALFRSLIAGRRLLLLLDNASATGQVRSLLPGGDDCTVIVTSRERLTGMVAKEGARRLPLDVMADAEARSLLSDAVGDTRLAAEPGIVGELVRLCGNLPLALRITAADLISHPQRSLAKHLDGLRTGNRLDALQVTDDDGTAVRAAFRSSYARLPDEVRRLFRMLGLFPGTEIGSESAAALMGTDTAETGRLLDRLLSAHLLAPRGPDRFALHDLLRLFATELVHEEDSDTARGAAVQRLYDRYTRTVDAAAKQLFPDDLGLPLSAEAARIPVHFDSDTAASDWLDAELPNLVAAVRQAAEHGPRLDACRLTASLYGYLYTKPDFAEWLSVARSGLSAARMLGYRRAQVIAHLSLAQLHRNYRQPRAAVKHFKAALVLSQHEGWLQGQATVHNDLSGIYELDGRLSLTAHHLYRALEFSRQANAIVDEAVVLGNLSRALLRMGEVADAVAHLERASKLHKQFGTRVSEARSLASLGEALGVQGEYDRALAVLSQATVVQQELDDRMYLPNTLRRLASAHLDVGECARAFELATAAVAMARETENRRTETWAILVLATVEERSDRYDSALDHYEQSRRFSDELGNRYLNVQATIGMGSTHRKLGQLAQARHHLDKALAIARRFGYRLLEREAEAVRATMAATDDAP